MIDNGIAKPAWLEVLKQAGTGAALLYAAGFLSLRAWLNLLGVWTGPPLVDQLYLAEGAQFAMATAEKVLYPWAFSVILLALCATAVFALIGLRARRWLTNTAGRVLGATPSWFGALTTLATFSILVKLIERVLLLPVMLPQSVLFKVPPPELRPATDYTWSVGVVVLIGVIAFTLWRVIHLKRGDAAARWCALGLFVFALFLLPMNFARIAKSRDVPIVRIEVEGAAGITGDRLVHLLLGTDKELVVHDGESIWIVDRERVHAFHVQCHNSVLAIPACPGGGRSTAGGNSHHAGAEQLSDTLNGKTQR